jgi:hypothetical protein
VRGARGVAAVEPDELERLIDPWPLPAFGAGEAEADVLAGRQMREQRAFLGDVADLALVGCDVHAIAVCDRLPVESDGSGVELDEADDRPQQRCLAAARGAEDRRQRSRRNLEVDVAQHDATAVGLGETLTAQFGHPQPSPRARTSPKRLIRT